MPDFDLILGMDWLASHHVVLNCYAETIILEIPRMSLVIWQGSMSRVPIVVISYIKA